MSSRFIHVAALPEFSSFLRLNIIPLTICPILCVMYIPHFVYSCTCWWMLGLLLPRLFIKLGTQAAVLTMAHTALGDLTLAVALTSLPVTPHHAAPQPRWPQSRCHRCLLCPRSRTPLGSSLAPLRAPLDVPFWDSSFLPPHLKQQRSASPAIAVRQLTFLHSTDCLTLFVFLRVYLLIVSQPE